MKGVFMMKRIVCFMLLAFASLTILPCGGVAGETVKDAVATAASKGLSTFLQQIPRQETAYYGFKNVQEMSRTHLGTPIEIFTVQPDALMSYSGTGFGLLLHTTGQWYVPILVGPEYRALLTVTQMDDDWEVVGISAAKLAGELQAFGWDLPALLTSAGAQQKGEPRFVRIFQAYSDFMYIPTAQEEYLVPFSSARSVLELTPDKLLSPGMVIPILKMEMDRS
jgi:hypothetical protein